MTVNSRDITFNYKDIRKEFIYAFLRGRKGLHELEDKYKLYRGTLSPILKGKKYVELKTVMTLADYYKCRTEEARSVFEPISPQEFQEIRREINMQEMSNETPKNDIKYNVINFERQKQTRSRTQNHFPNLEEHINIREQGETFTEKVSNFCKAIKTTPMHYYHVRAGSRRFSLTKANEIARYWKIPASDVALILGDTIGNRPYKMTYRISGLESTTTSEDKVYAPEVAQEIPKETKQSKEGTGLYNFLGDIKIIASAMILLLGGAFIVVGTVYFCVLLLK